MPVKLQEARGARISGSRPKRITLAARPTTASALAQTADALELSQARTIKLAVSVLSRITSKLAKGAKLVLRNKDGHEEEIWLAALGLGEDEGTSTQD